MILTGEVISEIKSNDISNKSFLSVNIRLDTFLHGTFATILQYLVK
jgi:hypothetical protein